VYIELYSHKKVVTLKVLNVFEFKGLREQSKDIHTHDYICFCCWHDD
jgi:hypothetical protein